MVGVAKCWRRSQRIGRLTVQLSLVPRPQSTAEGAKGYMMRRGTGALWLGLGIAASTAACSVLFDLGGLTAGPQDDAGAGGEGGNVDSGSFFDGAIDSGDSGDAGSRDAEPDVAPPATCNSPSTLCTLAAPSGWTGPLSFYDGDPSNVPACAGTTLDALDANHDFQSQPQVQCTACTCGVTSSSCTTLVTGNDGAMCNGCLTVPQSMPFGQCLYMGMTCSGFPFASIAVSSIATGACTSDGGVASVPAAVWKSAVRACKAPASAIQQVDCAAGQVCVPKGAPPFGAGACVIQQGDVACPGQPYINRTLVYAGTSDTRGCAPCGCDVAPQACSGGISLYFASDSTCSSLVYGPYSFTPGCMDNLPGPLYAKTYGSVPSLSCTTDGGVAVGTVQPAMPVTVCCE
jgi:hypothetical protein